MRKFNKHDHRANWSDSRATASEICPQTSAPIVLIHCWTRTSKCRSRRDADDCCYSMCWWWCPGPDPNHCCHRFVPAAADVVAVCVTTRKWPQWRPPGRWSRAHRTRSPAWRWTGTACPRLQAYAHAARNLRLKGEIKKERHVCKLFAILKFYHKDQCCQIGLLTIDAQAQNLYRNRYPGIIDFAIELWSIVKYKNENSQRTKIFQAIFYAQKM